MRSSWNRGERAKPPAPEPRVAHLDQNKSGKVKERILISSTQGAADIWGGGGASILDYCKKKRNLKKKKRNARAGGGEKGAKPQKKLKGK